MRLSQNNEAIAQVRKNPRMREALKAHVSEVRAHELDMLASASEFGDMRFLQGRVAVLNDLLKLLD